MGTDSRRQGQSAGFLAADLHPMSWLRSPSLKGAGGVCPIPSADRTSPGHRVEGDLFFSLP